MATLFSTLVSLGFIALVVWAILEVVNSPCRGWLQGAVDSAAVVPAPDRTDHLGFGGAAPGQGRPDAPALVEAAVLH